MDVDAAELTITQAAAALGISENALRLRLNRGQTITTTYTARKDAGGRWRVVVNDMSPGSDATDGGHSRDHVPTMSVVTATQLQQIEMIRDQWVAPFVARLEARAEEVGQLTRDVEQLTTALATTRAEVEQLRAELATERASSTASVSTGSTPRGSWWRRLGRGGS